MISNFTNNINISYKYFLFFFIFSSFFIFSAEDSKEKLDIESLSIRKPFIQKINSVFDKILFFDVTGGAIVKKKNDKPILDKNGNPQTVPFWFVFILLILGSLGFSIFYRFVNFRYFFHAIKIVSGKYDDPNSKGEVSHFKALTSALSGTIGLGNIAGVAVAISAGGPGAVFWMSLISIFSMTFKFHSCTLGQIFRKIKSDGSVSGGPMYYLEIGLKEKKLALVGKILGIFFAIGTVLATFGAGNMFQANQSYSIFKDTFFKSMTDNHNSLGIIFGIVLAFLAGVVIIGGIKKIGNVTSKLIPFMCVFYLVCGLFVIAVNINNLLPAVATIFKSAFYDNAIYGGLLGVLIIGVTRAAFSNEAGLGSASIIHASAKTKEPVREGFVAMLGPVIDTLILCNMTAIVIVITGTWEESGSGVLMTSKAFSTVLPWFPYTLTVAVFLFCYSTIISWSYYGEKAFNYLVEKITNNLAIQSASISIYRLIFLSFIVYGTVNTLDDVIGFSDRMLLSMVIPNIIGGVILAPTVWKYTKKYISENR